MARPKKPKAAYEERIDTLSHSFEYVMDHERALEILDIIGDDHAALDFETTGLDPTYSKVRLSCIYHPDTGVVLLDHFFCGSFQSMVHHMLRPLWLVYNSKFELRWFDKFVPNQGDLVDIDFFYKVKYGGFPSSLRYLVKKVLYYDMDKQEQLSDWSAERLTHSQLVYAAKDAVVTWMAGDVLLDRLTVEQRKSVYVLQEAVPATVECEETGMILDTPVHLENIKKWKMKQELMLRRIRWQVPKSVLDNPSSDKQVSDFLYANLPQTITNSWPKTEAKKQLKLSKDIIGPIAAKSSYPFSRWLNALMRYRYYGKYLSTYGETLVRKQYLEDKITYRLNIGQAATCRYSSSSINIQNIPRAAWVRRVFLPPSGYDLFVVADYSGVEVRVLAELSGDEQLKQDAIYGDVHSGSASAIYKIDETLFRDVIGDEDNALYYRYKELRSRAKGFTFQNVYGAQALALSIVLKCSIEEAEEALKAWATRYPKAYNYRYVMNDHMTNGGYLPVCDGRTIQVHRNDRTLPVAANYPIQGAAASVMYRAMHHVYERRNLVTNRANIAMCATVHDELILAVKGDWVEPAKELLVHGMQQGWLDIFPGTSVDNLVEAGVGPNWGSAK